MDILDPQGLATTAAAGLALLSLLAAGLVATVLLRDPEGRAEKRLRSELRSRPKIHPARISSLP